MAGAENIADTDSRFLAVAVDRLPLDANDIRIDKFFKLVINPFRLPIRRGKYGNTISLQMSCFQGAPTKILLAFSRLPKREEDHNIQFVGDDPPPANHVGVPRMDRLIQKRIGRRMEGMAPPAESTAIPPRLLRAP